MDTLCTKHASSKTDEINGTYDYCGLTRYCCRSCIRNIISMKTYKRIPIQIYAESVSIAPIRVIIICVKTYNRVPYIASFHTCIL